MFFPSLPYDIRVIGNKPETESSDLYIEVKATATSKHVFPISLPELIFAQQHRENYLLYIVCKSATRSRLFVISDVTQHQLLLNINLNV